MGKQNLRSWYVGQNKEHLLLKYKEEELLLMSYMTGDEFSHSVDLSVRTHILNISSNREANSN